MLSFSAIRLNTCWLVVELGGSQEQRLDRSDERSKEGKRENEKEGGESPPRSFVSNPSFLFYILKFLLAKIQQKHVFDRSSYFQSDFADQIAP
jgi:hypothetical protein